MGRKRKFGRPLHGVVLIDKAAGMTSNDVVQKAKRLFFAQKAGHTGALDPLATGVLPVCFGEATKFSQFLLDADKVYESTFCIGITTDTGDADGAILEQRDASALSREAVKSKISNFLGDIQQVPPMYSALKRDGQPLYKLARQGIEVEREARPVTIFSYELLDFEGGEQASVKVRIACSKGTYIRVLAEDLGETLGLGAHVKTLRRVETGGFNVADAHTLAHLEAIRGENLAETLDGFLLGVDAAITSLPQLNLDEASAHYFLNGQSVMASEVYRIAEEGDKVRVFRTGTGENHPVFLGLGEVTDEGCIAPKRLVSVA